MFFSGLFHILVYSVTSLFLLTTNDNPTDPDGPGRPWPDGDENLPHYFFTSESYPWDDAKHYCEEDEAKLAEFRSKAELKKAIRIVTDNTDGGDFWIGGIYKKNTTKWEWATDHVQVNESITTWSEDPSILRHKKDSRLGIEVVDEEDANWIADLKNEKKLVLCQMPNEE